MVNSTEEDLDIQGFSATHPVARFFLQESTEQEYRKANFRAWGKSIRIPLIIVIIGEVLWIADYLSAIGILGTPTDPSAPTDYGQVAGWCLPALLCVGFLLFTFTRFFTWRSYKPFVPVVVIFAMLFHVLPVLAISPAVEHGDGFCGGEKQAQLVAEQGAWYVSKSLFYVLCIGFYSTCLPISLFLFFVCNGLYFVKTAMQWEQVCPANEKGKGRPVRGVGGGCGARPLSSRLARCLCDRCGARTWAGSRPTWCSPAPSPASCSSWPTTQGGGSSCSTRCCTARWTCGSSGSLASRASRSARTASC